MLALKVPTFFRWQRYAQLLPVTPPELEKVRLNFWTYRYDYFALFTLSRNPKLNLFLFFYRTWINLVKFRVFRFLFSAIPCKNIKSRLTLGKNHFTEVSGENTSLRYRHRSCHSSSLITIRNNDIINFGSISNFINRRAIQRICTYVRQSADPPKPKKNGRTPLSRAHGSIQTCTSSAPLTQQVPVVGKGRWERKEKRRERERDR